MNASCFSLFTIVAEREGFEPPDPCRSTVFKTAAFDRSAIFPNDDAPCCLCYSFHVSAPQSLPYYTCLFEQLAVHFERVVARTIFAVVGDKLATHAPAAFSCVRICVGAVPFELTVFLDDNLDGDSCEGDCQQQKGYKYDSE